MPAATDPEHAYTVDDPGKIQGRDEVRPGDRSLAAVRLQRALNALDNRQQSILMPGCGAGRYARAVSIAHPDWRIVGGDLSSVAIDEARQAGGGPEYLAFDAEDIPFPDGSFDAVVFFDLLEHVPHPGQLLSECHRVLRPGGVLHFFVPLEDQPGTLYQLFAHNRPVPIHRWKHDHVGHIQRFRDADVIRLTWASGLSVCEVDYSFHLAGQIHDLLDYWQRERAAGGRGILPLPAVATVTRLAFLGTWRLSYLEDRIYSGPRLASGLHVTARKPF